MAQGDPLGLTLLRGVPEEDLERERQQLADVRPNPKPKPTLHGPGMLGIPANAYGVGEGA